MKCSRVQFCFVWWLAVVGSGSCWYGRRDEQKLLFVPDAHNEPDVEHELSEPALFRFLLNEETLKILEYTEAEIPEMLGVLEDIDKESKIKEFEIHQSGTGKAADLKGAFHTFVVFKTTSETEGDDWWSLEQNLECIILQRSGNKGDVKHKLDGVERIHVKPVKEGLKGKGTIRDLFALLWAHQIVAENMDAEDSNCQTFVTLISQRMTGYENEAYFKCSSPHENERKTNSLNFLNSLSKVTKWHPLFTFIHLENTDLIDAVMESGEYGIDVLHRENIALNQAISFSKTKMVEHFLKPPYSADPTTLDANGMNKLQIAATYATKTEIFDLLLAHDKVSVDDVNESGQTALHAAVVACNVIAVKHLINKGANPNIIDKNGTSPLHVAARARDGNPIIDLLLEAKKVKGMGDVNDRNEDGVTALHYAAFESNEITAEHLIKKGADANHRDIEGHTPLHVAAMHAKDMSIIDLLLKNIEDEARPIDKTDATAILACANMNNHGLADQIVARLVEKDIASIEESQSIEIEAEMFRIRIKNQKDSISTETYGEIGMNVLHLASMFAKTTDLIDDVLETGEFNINGGDNDGNTPLHYAIGGINPTTIIPHLMLKGADPNAADKNGVTPLHLAASSAKDVHVVELLLNHPEVDANLMDDDGRTAENYAMNNEHGLGEAIAHLLREKTTTKRENKPDAEALDRAIQDSDVDVIRALIKNGLNFSAGDEIKMSALHMASRYAKTTDVIDIILETGEFDINGVDNDGLTPLHHAILGINPTINVPHLIQLGADPNVADKNGVTPLNTAARNAESMNFIELFLKREAVGVGYCDKQEHNFYPTNVCRVNSY